MSASMPTMSKALRTILKTNTDKVDNSRVSHTQLPKEAKVNFPKRNDVQPQQAIEKYIPQRALHDPVKLGTQTVQAVDAIGSIASSSIENVIEEIEKGTTELVSELHALADGIRVSTVEASCRVAAWCDRVNGLVAGIRHVQDIIQPAPAREAPATTINDVEKRMNEMRAEQERREDEG